MTEPDGEEWIELSSGYDHAAVKAEADGELRRVGLNANELSGKDLRMDVGIDMSKKQYFKVSVRRHLLDS